MRPLSYPPPPKKSTKILFKKRCRHVIPQPFQPPPPRTLIKCGVVEVVDRAMRSNLPAWLQIATSILQPPAEKIDQNPLRKMKMPRHPPAVPAPAPAYAR